MNTTKVAVGSLLLVVSSVIILAAGAIETQIPIAAAGVASLGMAAGALLLGTSEDDGRPV